MSAHDQKRAELVELGHQLLADHLVVRTWGNFSLRLEGSTFLITPSGRRYETMQNEDLTVVNEDGWTGPFKPSSEYPMHAATYARFPRAQTVIHTHQPYASALSLGSGDIELSEEDAEVLGQPTIPIAGYGLPSTGKLHKNVEATLERTGSRVILLKAHGAIIWAEDSAEARRLGNALEAIAKKIYLRTIYGPGPYLEVPAEGSHSERGGGLVADGRPNPGEEADHCRIYANRPDVGAIITVTDRDVRAFVGSTLKPYLDDFAQLVGIKADGSVKHNLILTKHRAYAVGPDLEAAQNVASVSIKNARAARYATAHLASPINVLECILMNQIYQRKYSKQAG